MLKNGSCIECALDEVISFIKTELNEKNLELRKRQGAQDTIKGEIEYHKRNIFFTESALYSAQCLKDELCNKKEANIEQTT